MLFVRTNDPYRDLRRSVEEAPQDGPEVVILVSLALLIVGGLAACGWLAWWALQRLVGGNG